MLDIEEEQTILKTPLISVLFRIFAKGCSPFAELL